MASSSGDKDIDKNDSKESSKNKTSKTDQINFEEFSLTNKKTAKMAKSAAGMLSMSTWDPVKSYDWDQAGPPGFLAATRIRRDISILYKEPLPGIFIVPDDNNICIVHALIIGPFDTPYEGGFFHFLVRFGPSYPLHPPRVRLLTTDRGRVRFNPNLYADGKVCLSILGTWSGPPWSPATNLGALLLSVQSLLNDEPFYNEPGFQKEKHATESEYYNRYLTHESIRVTICQRLELLLEGRTDEHLPLPDDLLPIVKSTFLNFYEHYVDTCQDMKKFDGKELKDRYCTIIKSKNQAKSPQFDFVSLLSRLDALKARLEAESTSELGEKSSCHTSLSSLSNFSGESDKEIGASGSALSFKEDDHAMPINEEINFMLAEDSNHGSVDDAETSTSFEGCLSDDQKANLSSGHNSTEHGQCSAEYDENCTFSTDFVQNSDCYGQSSTDYGQNSEVYGQSSTDSGQISEGYGPNFTDFLKKSTDYGKNCIEKEKLQSYVESNMCEDEKLSCQSRQLDNQKHQVDHQQQSGSNKSPKRDNQQHEVLQQIDMIQEQQHNLIKTHQCLSQQDQPTTVQQHSGTNLNQEQTTQQSTANSFEMEDIREGKGHGDSKVDGIEDGGNRGQASSQLFSES